MESVTLSKKTRFQFSIRRMLVVFAAISICLAVFTPWYWQARQQTFAKSVVYPIGRTFVSSIGYANDRILWLRFNAIDPAHPNGYDEWIVPIPMDMYYNDGAIGNYSTFADGDLQDIVNKHHHLRAVDLRTTAVTDVGLRHLSELKRLEWLWLDDTKCTEEGRAALRHLSSLRSLVLEVGVEDAELIDELKDSLPLCEIVITVRGESQLKTELPKR